MPRQAKHITKGWNVSPAGTSSKPTAQVVGVKLRVEVGSAIDDVAVAADTDVPVEVATEIVGVSEGCTAVTVLVEDDCVEVGVGVRV